MHPGLSPNTDGFDKEQDACHASAEQILIVVLRMHVPSLCMHVVPCRTHYLVDRSRLSHPACQCLVGVYPACPAFSCKTFSTTSVGTNCCMPRHYEQGRCAHPGLLWGPTAAEACAQNYTLRGIIHAHDVAVQAGRPVKGISL